MNHNECERWQCVFTYSFNLMTQKSENRFYWKPNLSRYSTHEKTNRLYPYPRIYTADSMTLIYGKLKKIHKICCHSNRNLFLSKYHIHFKASVFWKENHFQPKKRIGEMNSDIKNEWFLPLFSYYIGRLRETL